MNKLKYLNNWLGRSDNSELDKSITISLMYALSPQEACSFFELMFNHHYKARHYLLRKIQKDIREEYLSEHKKLITNLCDKLEEQDFKEKSSCAFSLDYLFDELSDEERVLILNFFLKSKYKDIRDRGLRRLHKNWDSKYQEIVLRVWGKYKDSSILSLIIKHFPGEFLLSMYKELIPYAEPYQISNLFLKLANIDFNTVYTLRDIDPISYAYVLTKLNKTLSNNEAKLLLKDNYMDERIGLLLWCLGQMKLWDSIVEFEKKYRKKHVEARRSFCEVD